MNLRAPFEFANSCLFLTGSGNAVITVQRLSMDGRGDGIASIQTGTNVSAPGPGILTDK